MQAQNGQPKIAPGPQGHFLIGSMHEFKHNILEAIEQARHTYGDMVRFKLGPKSVYVVCSPELAEEVLVKQKDVYLKKGMNTKKPAGLQLLLGNSLLCIGSNFALIEGELLLALMAQNYELCLAPNQRVEAEVAITLRPRYGLQMSIHSRQRYDYASQEWLRETINR